MKIFLYLILIAHLLYAKEETCYTVQLESRKYSQDNLDAFQKKKYPEKCKVMQISQSLTVRCGCYEHFDEAKILLEKLKGEYKKSRVVITYSYRFSNNKKNSNQKKFQAPSKEDDELRLMLQVFLYKSDLEKAYEVAKVGYEKNKNSYYWNQKMAEICQWSNRAAESMKYLKNIYEIKHDEKIEQKLIDYGYGNYRYEDVKEMVLNRTLRNPNKKNIDFLIALYAKIGYPEEVLPILDKEYAKHPQNSFYIEKALDISLYIGDLDSAKKYVKLIEKQGSYSKKVASLVANYYYIKRDMLKAYNATLYAKKEDNSSDSYKFYEFKSDLAWYLQKTKSAAEASLHLMKIKTARVSDYERISFFYKDKKPKIALEALKESYARFKYSYLFYAYATQSIKYKQYDDLKKLMKKLEKKRADVTKQSLYWLTKAQLYGLSKSHEDKLEEKHALDRALALSPKSTQARNSLLWFVIGEKDNIKIKALLQKLAQEENLDASFYFPMASAYLALNDVNSAQYYTDKLVQINHPMIKEKSFKQFQATIYQAQGREELYKEKNLEIYRLLKKELKEKPALFHNRDFLLDYLNLSMQMQSPDTFEKRLIYAKRYITKEDYKKLMYAYSLKLQNSEMSLRAFNSIKYKPLWMRFNNAYMFQEHSNIENYIDIYLSSLANVNISQAAYEDGQQALAQSNLFEAFNQNSYSSSLYSQHLSLSQLRSDKLEVKTAYYQLGNLEQEYVNLQNSSYLYRNYYIVNDIYFSKNRSLDTGQLFGFDDKSVMISMGVKKVFDKGSVEADFSYHNSLRSYYGYKLLVDYRLSSHINTKVDLEKGADAVDSSQLLLGAKRDVASLNVNYSFVNTTQLDILHEESLYSSQDDKYLGRGDYSRLTLSRQYRSAYPDMKMALYYDRVLYDENNRPKGVVEKLLQAPGNVLGKGFYDLGLNLSYGMINDSSYTRVWRPFVSFSPYYNSVLDDYSYGLYGGIGGKIWHQDHLVIGASYADAFKGVGSKVFEISLKYQFLYKHP